IASVDPGTKGSVSYRTMAPPVFGVARLRPRSSGWTATSVPASAAPATMLLGCAASHAASFDGTSGLYRERPALASGRERPAESCTLSASMPPPGQAPGRPQLARCPLCAHEELVYQFTHEITPIVRCAGCALLMRNPQPSDAELGAIYTDTYFLGSTPTERTAGAAVHTVRSAE